MLSNIDCTMKDRPEEENKKKKRNKERQSKKAKDTVGSLKETEKEGEKTPK